MKDEVRIAAAEARYTAAAHAVQSGVRYELEQAASHGEASHADEHHAASPRRRRKCCGPA